MSPERTILLFNAVLLISGLFGYISRKRGWISAARAGTFMSLAMIVFEGPLALLAVWRLHMEPGAWKLPFICTGMALGLLLVGFGLARVGKLPRLQVPSFAFGSSISNIGYTLGGYIALSLLGHDGLGYQFIYTAFWPLFIFLVIFPIGHHYASNVPLNPLQLIRRSLLDLRSMPLYGLAVGLILNHTGVPYPEESLGRFHLVDALLIGGMACSYIGIGLTVSLRAMRPYLRQSVLIGLIKFVVTPALMLGLLTLIGYTGTGRQLCLLLAFMPCGIYSVMVATIFGTDRDLAMTNFLLTHAFFFAVILWFVLPWAITL